MVSLFRHDLPHGYVSREAVAQIESEGLRFGPYTVSPPDNYSVVRDDRERIVQLFSEVSQGPTKEGATVRAASCPGHDDIRFPAQIGLDYPRLLQSIGWLASGRHPRVRVTINRYSRHRK